MIIHYEGKIKGFLNYALPELRRCAMRGMTIQHNTIEIQKTLRQAQIKDLREQILTGGKGKKQ